MDTVGVPGSTSWVPSAEISRFLSHLGPHADTKILRKSKKSSKRPPRALSEGELEKQPGERHEKPRFLRGPTPTKHCVYIQKIKGFPLLQRIEFLPHCSPDFGSLLTSKTMEKASKARERDRRGRCKNRAQKRTLPKRAEIDVDRLWGRVGHPKPPSPYARLYIYIYLLIYLSLGLGGIRVQICGGWSSQNI